jgi:hypothetical protein
MVEAEETGELEQLAEQVATVREATIAARLRVLTALTDSLRDDEFNMDTCTANQYNQTTAVVDILLHLGFGTSDQMIEILRRRGENTVEGIRAAITQLQPEESTEPADSEYYALDRPF